MKLFGKGTVPMVPVTAVLPETGPEPGSVPKIVRQIAMSAEQKAMLATPVDPRVDRIIRNLFVDRSAAEKALKDGHPGDTVSQRYVVQDVSGMWRIASGPAANPPVGLIDGL